MIQPADISRKSRRGILAALGLGGAATAFALSSRPAQAQETETTDAPATTGAPTDTVASETPTTEPMLIATAEPTSETVDGATPSTMPPSAIQPEDRPLVAAAKVLELTIAAAYANANARIADLGLDDAGTTLFAALEAHHRAYAEALSAAYGPGAPSNSNPALLAKIGGDTFASGPTMDVLMAAHEAEHAAADTYLTMLGTVRSTSIAALLASIQITEYRHAATITAMHGGSEHTDDAAIEDGAEALSVDTITGGN